MIFAIPLRRQRTPISEVDRQLPAPGIGEVAAVLEFYGDGQVVVRDGRVFAEAGGESGDDPVP